MNFELSEQRVAGGVVPYRVGGTGPLVVCFYNAPVGVISPAIEVLAGRRTVLLPMTPGHDYTVAMPAAAGAELLAGFIAAKAGAERCDLLGLGGGAPAALLCAAQHPDRIGRLVVQAPATVDGELAGLLARIRAQTLIVQGTRDTSVPPGAGHALKAQIRGAHLSYIHDADEAVDTDQPKRFARLVAAYLDYGPAFIVKRSA